jgi:hypothetical protein
VISNGFGGFPEKMFQNMVEVARVVESEVEPSCAPLFMLSSLASVKINLFKIKEKWLPLGWCLYQKFEDVYYRPRQGGSC